MLRLAGVPLRAADRDYTHPLVVIGGAVTFVNPEPLALFADVIAAGEGEALVPALVDAFGTSSRSEQLKRLAQARGYYIPSFYDVEYGADGTIARYVPREGTGAPPVVRKAALKTTDAVDPPSTTIFTPDTEFGSRFLIEVVRGCANLCRFCWAGYNYLPVRAFPTERILELAQAARAHSSTRRPGVDRAVRSPGHRAHPAQPQGHGLFDQPGVAAPRRPDADDRVAAQGERRAHADHCAGDRLRSPAPRDQQDDHQRRDPRSRRADLFERHREPEALLHDRPPDRGGRRPGGDSRPDAAAARDHAEARARRAAASAASSPASTRWCRSRAPPTSGCRWSAPT